MNPFTMFLGRRRETIPAGSEYSLRTQRGSCRIDRHPDDKCEFYDENNTEWNLFGFTEKRFQSREMITEVVRKKLDDRRFAVRLIREYGKELGLIGLSYESRIERLMEAIPDILDPEGIAKTMRYAPVTDTDIEGSKGMVAILVRRDQVGTAISIGDQILDIERI